MNYFKLVIFTGSMVSFWYTKHIDLVALTGYVTLMQEVFHVMDTSYYDVVGALLLELGVFIVARLLNTYWLDCPGFLNAWLGQWHELDGQHCRPHLPLARTSLSPSFLIDYLALPSSSSLLGTPPFLVSWKWQHISGQQAYSTPFIYYISTLKHLDFHAAVH